MKKYKYLFHKIFNWEYWPQWIVYAPLLPVYVYYTLKAKTPFFITAANPSMENGGYLMESKFTIHNQLPQHLVPLTILINKNYTIEIVLLKLVQSKITYPFFCKPDIGGKGRGVEKIENSEQLIKYHSSCPINYIIQQTILYKNEIGVFYCRMPNETNGFITGIVSKQPIRLVGNGVSSVKELIESIPRYYFQRKSLFKKYKNDLQKILASNETFTLSEIGNHARGSLFTDVTNCNTPQLEKIIDAISKQYNTFYFGRYDIKFNTWDELYEWKNFMLIELNGSGSEPTHIYDPNKSILEAWKIVLHHWKLLYQISSMHHENGVPYLKLKQGLQLIKQEREIAKKFKHLI